MAVTGRLVFGTGDMVVAATVAGQGLAWIPDDAVAEHIGAGQLVSVLDDWAQTVSEYHAYRATCSSSPAAGLVLDAPEVRFLDRFFDLHVMNPVQHAVGGALTGDPVKRRGGLALAVEKLERAYAWLDGQLAGRTWAAGADFTLAACAAAPSLFYADWTHRISEAFPMLRAYHARLLARSSFARAVEEARPFRPIFPLGATDRD